MSAAITVRQLNVGWITAPAGIWRKGEDMERKIRFPIPAYLIETPERRILVDTGLHPDSANASEHYAGAQAMSLFELEPAELLAEQVDLGTLTEVVMTHLHFDHAGALSTIPESVPIVLQRKEWDAAYDDDAIARNFYLPIDYASVADRVVLVDGDHDLCGDGSIELLFTPGHTPGHQSIRVGESLIIGADVSHFAAGYDDHRFPIFADDHEAQTASAEQLRKRRDAGATVLPGHDPDVLRPGLVEL